MIETCGIAWLDGETKRVTCGKPAVDHIDIPAPALQFVRLHLCADHNTSKREELEEFSVKPGLLRHQQERENFAQTGHYD